MVNIANNAPSQRTKTPPALLHEEDVLTGMHCFQIILALPCPAGNQPQQMPASSSKYRQMLSQCQPASLDMCCRAGDQQPLQQPGYCARWHGSRRLQPT